MLPDTMVGDRTFRLAVGLAVLVAHFVLSFGLSRLIFWLYFDAGVKWTADPVVPQIQAVLAFMGQIIAAVILTCAVIIGKWRGWRSAAIAALWPFLLVGLPLLMPAFLIWVILAIALIALGLVVARNMMSNQRA